MVNGATPPADLVVDNGSTSTLATIGIIVAVLAICFGLIYICMMFYYAFYKKTGMKLFIRHKKTKNVEKHAKCPICGEPSETRLGEPRQDKLCPCHAAMLRDDQIALCKYCGSWYNTSETCKCRKLD